jgi:hypothetical protein
MRVLLFFFIFAILGSLVSSNGQKKKKAGGYKKLGETSESGSEKSLSDKSKCVGDRKTECDEICRTQKQRNVKVDRCLADGCCPDWKPEPPPPPKGPSPAGGVRGRAGAVVAPAHG